MDFSVDPEFAKLLQRLRHFVEAEVIPLEGIIHEGGFAANEDELQAMREKARAATCGK